MSLSDKQWIFFKDMMLLVNFAERKGWKLTPGEFWRHSKMQMFYFLEGKSKTTEGQHNKRLAGDVNLFIDNVYQTETESYKELGDFWESIRPENRWGGRWNDGNHFEQKG